MTAMRPIAGLSELPEGRLPGDLERANGLVIYSLTAHAICAMERHKWIESEKYARDVGEGVFREWVERFWKGWVRQKLMEHLYGWRFWGAFDDPDFGLLARHSVEYHVSHSVLEKVASILGDGGENLDVITWGLGAGEQLDPILWLLDRIDINAKRHRLLTDHIRLFVDSFAPANR